MNTGLYLEAPQRPTSEELNKILSRSIFLAGGITNCWNWQNYAFENLNNIEGLYIINPRCENFDEIADLKSISEQIEWEYYFLEIATQIMFWFCSETVQPITLYELGKELGKRNTLLKELPYGRIVDFTRKQIFVGCDLNYPRIADLQIQLKLIAPDIPIYYSLDGIIRSIVEYNKNEEQIKHLMSRLDF